MLAHDPRIARGYHITVIELSRMERHDVVDMVVIAVGIVTRDDVVPVGGYIVAELAVLYRNDRGDGTCYAVLMDVFLARHYIAHVEVVDDDEEVVSYQIMLCLVVSHEVLFEAVIIRRIGDYVRKCTLARFEEVAVKIL